MMMGIKESTVSPSFCYFNITNRRRLLTITLHYYYYYTTTTTTVLRLSGICPWLRRWAGTRKVKPRW